MHANAANERIKRRYFEYLRETLGLSDKTIEHAASAIHEYEKFVGFEDFKLWSLPKAKRFKKGVMGAASKRSGAPTSRATGVTKLRLVKNFFLWLATQPGYRAKITRAEAQYLNPLRRDARLAAAPSLRPAPTLEQARKVILSMPSSTDVELRNRALVACALLTGARVSALISLKLKHVMPDRQGIIQDGDEVHTKFSKYQETFFVGAVGEDIRQIFVSYVDHLRTALLWGDNDPLFPATMQTVGADHQFHVTGLKRQHWRTPDPVRSVFKSAYAAAELPYFQPHTMRSCLMNMAERLCSTGEELKAFSLNLGHDELRTSLTSYGSVSTARRAEILRDLHEKDGARTARVKAILSDPDILGKLKEILA